MIIIYHIDESMDESENISILLKEFPQIFLVALLNNPDDLADCRLLKMGYKSYLHSFSNAKIASELDIAEFTVKKHISSLFKKLDVHDRLSLSLLVLE